MRLDRRVAASLLRRAADSHQRRRSCGRRARADRRLHCRVSIPADALTAADGPHSSLTSDRSFVAGEEEGTADRRKLAIRVYALTRRRK